MFVFTVVVVHPFVLDVSFAKLQLLLYFCQHVSCFCRPLHSVFLVVNHIAFNIAIYLQCYNTEVVLVTEELVEDPGQSSYTINTQWLDVKYHFVAKRGSLPDLTFHHKHG